MTWVMTEEKVKIEIEIELLRTTGYRPNNVPYQFIQACEVEQQNVV